MQYVGTSPRLYKLGFATVGIVAASVVLAGCSKKVTPTATPTSQTTNSYTNTVTNDTGSAPTAPNTNSYQAAPSPMVKVTTTNQAVTNEGAALNKLNQDAGSVDQ